ncbi:HK97 gp10 family phage protein [Desulfitispora alkaliphila]|uniref:HK97-gp10 family putative phage morphogenesis protein n=1 Tax=Desulfitispora alkaliphila TaxID=622674 RepID=UPI003D1B7AE6
MTNIEVEGIEQVLTEIQKLEGKGKKIENRALKEAGKVVEEAIKSETPERTGTLKKSISTSGVKTKDGFKHVKIGPDKEGWYGIFVEFGTVNMRANPFVGRGYEKSKNQAMAKISEELRKGLGL